MVSSRTEAKPVSDIVVMQSLINSYRRSNGLGELRINNILTQAANSKTLKLISTDTFVHSDPLNLFTSSLGYKDEILSELLSQGYPNEESVFNHWRISPEHDLLMLDPRFCEFGYSLELQNQRGKDSYIATLYLGTPTGGCDSAVITTSTSEPTAVSSISSVSVASSLNPSSSITTKEISEESSTSNSNQISEYLSDSTTSKDLNTGSNTSSITSEYGATQSTSSANESAVSSASASNSAGKLMFKENDTSISASELGVDDHIKSFSTEMKSIQRTSEKLEVKVEDPDKNYKGTITLVIFMSTIGLSLTQVHKIILSGIVDKIFPV